MNTIEKSRAVKIVITDARTNKVLLDTYTRDLAVIFRDYAKERDELIIYTDDPKTLLESANTALKRQ